MTSEFLLNAIGMIDDELVMEAVAPTRRTIPWLRVSSLAAAFLLCVGVASLPCLMPKNSAGTAAAPESDGGLGSALLDRYHYAADQDAVSNSFEHRSEQESQVQMPSAMDKGNFKTEAAGTTQGFFEPRFLTQRGVYLLMGEEFPHKPKLPDTENLYPLGELVATVPGEQVYPSTGTKEYIGCPVWESEDGRTIYIQLKDGGCLFARLCE